ncbi:MAG: hypothetical protein ACE5LU_01735 [Anaerolineae bacterium]
MLKQQTTLEWQIGETEDWDSFEPLEIALDTATASRRTAGWRRHLGRVLRALVLVALLAAIAVGYSLWRGYQENITRIRTDIQSTLDLEAWAWKSDDEALTSKLIDSQASGGWARRFRRTQEWYRRWAGDEARVPVVEIQNMELGGDLALVEVLVTQPGVPWAATPYRETRFYRKVEERWQRTAPGADFWGPQRVVETEHFRFVFHQRDAEAVGVVVDEVEGLYAALRHDAGLGPPATEERLTIEIVPRTDMMYWRFTEDRLTVPSPALLPVPEELPDAARLIGTIAYPLARQVLDEALQQTQVKSGWQPMADGLRLWLGWDGSVMPSAWRYRVEGLLRERLAESHPLRLADLAAWRAGRWNWQDRWVRSMAAETVVEYVVATYGRERLPALLQGLDKYETWDALTPAVFDVPAGVFEAGWQTYLVARYAPLTADLTEEPASE